MRKFENKKSILFLVVALLSFVVFAAAASAQVYINEVYVDPNNQANSFVELYNNGGHVSLINWRIDSATNTGNMLTGTLDSNNKYITFNPTQVGFNFATSDVFRLYDLTNNTVDTFAYVNATGNSVGRNPDGNSNIIKFQSPIKPTPNMPNGNQNPVILTPINLMLNEDFSSQLFSLTNYESDFEDGPAAVGNNLVWNVQSYNTSYFSNVNMVNPTSADILRIQGRPDVYGTTNILLQLTDSLSATTTANLTVTISPVNDAPVINSNLSRTVQEDIPVTIDLTNIVQDVDDTFATLTLGDNSQYVTTSKTNTTANMTYNYVNPIGSEVFTFQVTDSGSLTASQPVQVTVTATDLMAYFTSGTISMNIAEDANAATYDLSTITDNDGETENITYSVVSELASEVDCNVTNNILTYQPAPDFAGTGMNAANCLIQVNDPNSQSIRTRTNTAGTDPASSQQVRFIFDVGGSNDPVQYIGTVTNFTFPENTNYTVDMTQMFSDADNSTLIYSATFGTGIQNVTFSGTTATIIPVPEWSGMTSVTFGASDGSTSASSGSIPVNITFVNDNAPVISQLPTITFQENSYNNSINLTNYINDPDTAFADLNITFVNVDSNLIVRHDPGDILYVGAVPNWNGESDFIIRVDDGANAALGNVHVSVNGSNNAPTSPILTSPVNGAALNVESNNPVVDFEWGQSYDDSSSLTYTLKIQPYMYDVDALPALVKVNLADPQIITQSATSATVTLNFLRNNALYDWTVTASDGEYNATSSTYTFTAVTNFPPTIDTFTPDQSVITINEGEEIQFNHTSSDLDNDYLEYSWTLDDAEVSTEESYLFETDFDDAGTYTVELTVTDTYSSQETSRTVTVIVTDVDQRISFGEFFPASDNFVIHTNGEQFFNASIVNPTDLPLSYRWLVDGDEVSTAPEYTLQSNGNGPYTVTLEVTSSLNTIIHTWIVQTSSVPVTQRFSGSITEFAPEELAAAQNVVIEVPGVGKIDFGSQVVDLRYVIDLDSFIVIDNNIVGIDTQQFPQLNRPATITLYNLAYDEVPNIYFTPAFARDRADCQYQSLTSTLVNYTAPPTTNGFVEFTVQGFSTYTIGTATPGSTTPTTPTTPTVPTTPVGNEGGILDDGMLRINDIEINNDNVRVDTYGRDTVDDIEPDQRVDIEIEVENIFPDRHDPDIEGIDVEVTISEIDGGDDLNFDNDRRFDLEPGEDETVRLDFRVPYEVEDGEKYEVMIEIDGTDDNGTVHRAQARAYIEVEKEDHFVKITELHITPSIVSCTRTADLRLEVTNFGKDDEDDAKVVVSNEDLGIKEEFEFDLDEDPYDEDFDLHKNLIIRMPEDADEGTYELSVKTYYDRTRVSDVRTVQVHVQGCEDKALTTYAKDDAISQLETELNNIQLQMLELQRNDLKKKTAVKETTYEDEELTTILILSIIIVVIIIGILLLVLFKPKKTRRRMSDVAKFKGTENKFY
ncbi:PKD domain-containing protein [Candidatus Woesearchaeota archaeon]|nr:PKD domain-containing protein [Candidatus Woesearchaeota archaeon]